MPIVNDTPQTIYVRDISDIEAESFAEIKTKFNLSSNSEVVKTLFVKYLQLEEEHTKLKAKYRKLDDENYKNVSKLQTIKDTIKMIGKL